MKKFKAKFDKKRQKVQNVFVEYRQWVSDVEHLKVYKACKVKFNLMLMNIKDPIWDDFREFFKDDSIKFFMFIESLSEEERQTIFNALWTSSMNDIVKDREYKLNRRALDNWEKLKAEIHITNSDMIKSFDEKIYLWKTNWKKDNWYLDLGRGPFEIRDDNSTTDYRYKIDEHYKDYYLKGELYEHKNEDESSKKKKLINWWNSTDWWKKF
jgi:hypothetical protein